ncbi:WD40 repeat protein [Dioscorea alata]|uniref:WD40 repeat protein n=1 Tax=Dioscorea alata TaxID=55571 RepID=A0ACB7UP94_DIOAL|nr:WD40 repeat protein [Dioscorea alata]
MSNRAQKPQGAVPRSGKGNGFFSRCNFSSYLRFVSTGASTVASTVRSAGASVASSIVGDDDDSRRDQVHWAGFDKLEYEGVLREVLLLGYRSGFQVWDVEEADDVRQLASKYEGFVSFMQMLKNPAPSRRCGDKFLDLRPLVAVVGDGSFSGSCNSIDALGSPCNGNMDSHLELGNENLDQTFVCFYSFRTHEYAHLLKFQSAIYSIRCSPLIVAVSLASQIYCFHSATLEREYIVCTHPIVSSISYGPLALGSRWLAYCGDPVAVSSIVRAIPHQMTLVTGLPTSLPNGNQMANFAKESTRQLAAGIITLGDKGYKKLSKYYTELLPEGNISLKHGNSALKTNGLINRQLPAGEHIGMVIVRDVVSKSVMVQFRAHESPISALCFDPTGTLLVTASIRGHNINVFHIIVPCPSGRSFRSDPVGTCTHLYRLQRGITNAIIRGISFSNDNKWIIVNSSRGTSHLFAIPHYANLHLNDMKDTANSNRTDLIYKVSVDCLNSSCSSRVDQQGLHPSGFPVALSAVSRLRNGVNDWKNAVTGAAAAATGRVAPLSGPMASVFHNRKSFGHYTHINELKTEYYLLVFSPVGSIIQYVLRELSREDSGLDLSGISTASLVSVQESSKKFVVEASLKWDICHARNRRSEGDEFYAYCEQVNGKSTCPFQTGLGKGTSPASSFPDMKAKLGTERNHRSYISEAEFLTHSASQPLWAKSEPKVYFEVMIDENLSLDGDSCDGIKIEKIPTSRIEFRSKVLVPFFHGHQMPQFPQSRYAC